MLYDSINVVEVVVEVHIGELIKLTAPPIAPAELCVKTEAPVNFTILPPIRHQPPPFIIAVFAVTLTEVIDKIFEDTEASAPPQFVAIFVSNAHVLIAIVFPELNNSDPPLPTVAELLDITQSLNVTMLLLSTKHPPPFDAELF